MKGCVGGQPLNKARDDFKVHLSHPEQYECLAAFLERENGLIKYRLCCGGEAIRADRLGMVTVLASTEVCMGGDCHEYEVSLSIPYYGNPKESYPHLLKRLKGYLLGKIYG